MAYGAEKWFCEVRTLLQFNSIKSLVFFKIPNSCKKKEIFWHS